MTDEKPKAQCPDCERMVLVNKDGNLRKHPWCAPVSDPAPTVNAMDDTQFEDPTTAAPAPEPTVSKGPWFGALYVGKCGSCEDAIHEGDRIRADGTGGYECGNCGDSPATVVPAKTSDWQAQASAAAKRHVAREADAGTLYLSSALVFADPHGEAASDAVAKLQEVALTAVAAMYSEPTPEAVQDAMPFEDPTTAADAPVKLNVSGQPPARRDWLKRYIVIDPDLGDFRRTAKGKPFGVTRATTFNKHAQNTIALNGWSKRNVAMGASLRPDILRRAHGLHHDTSRDQREALDRIVNELETAAGAKVSADEGTFLHEFCDQVDAGLKTWRDAPAMYQQDIKRYVEALAEEGLEPVPGLIERTTFIREHGGVAGTFDRIFYHRPSGEYIIGDLKTGKTMKYAMDETECQEWTYAHGVNQTGIYDWSTDTWLRPGTYGDSMELGPWQVPTVSETVGVIVHMPVQGPEAGEVYLRFANLERGKAYADLNHAVNSYPKSKVLPFKMPERAPEPAPEPELNKTTPEVWRALFGAVTTSEDASVLWKRAKEAGIVDVFLNELIALAQQSIRMHGKG